MNTFPCVRMAFNCARTKLCVICSPFELHQKKGGLNDLKKKKNQQNKEDLIVYCDKRGAFYL